MDGSAPLRWIRHCAVWLSDPYREYNRRRNMRFSANVEVAIHWGTGLLYGHSVNVSKGGMCVQLDDALPLGAQVLVRVKSIDRSGFASVRRCDARADHWEAALEFRDGLILDDRALTGFDYHRVAPAAEWNDPDA